MSWYETTILVNMKKSVLLVKIDIISEPNVYLISKIILTFLIIVLVGLCC